MTLSIASNLSRIQYFAPSEASQVFIIPLWTFPFVECYRDSDYGYF